MSKVVLIGIAAGIIVLAGLFFFVPRDTQEMTVSEDAMMTDDAAMDGESMEGEEMMMEDSRYVVYTPEKFNQAADKKRVYFFYAAWCPTCRPTDENFMANADEIPEDIVVFRTDYDTENELKKKYNITYQHTFVQVDSNGDEITKWNGGALDELKNNVQ